MATYFAWNGDLYQQAVNKIMLERLSRAARHVHNQMKIKLSLAGTGYASVSHARQEFRTIGGRPRLVSIWYKRKQHIYGFVRSKPGEPPRKQTGLLRRSVAYEVDAETLTARVGVGGPPVAPGHAYAVYLELGTSKMAPRPYLRTTMYEQAENIKAILEGRTATIVEGMSTAGGEGPIEAGQNLAEAAAKVQTIPLSGVRIDEMRSKTSGRGTKTP